MNNILLIIILFLIIISGLIFKLYKKERKQRLQSEINLKIAEKNIHILQDYTKTIREIKEKRTEIDKQIKEAKSDEDVFNVISTIIRTNNDRMHNSN
jgi:hypothetical protein